MLSAKFIVFDPNPPYVDGYPFRWHRHANFGRLHPFGTPTSKSEFHNAYHDTLLSVDDEGIFS